MQGRPAISMIKRYDVARWTCLEIEGKRYQPFSGTQQTFSSVFTFRTSKMPALLQLKVGAEHSVEGMEKIINVQESYSGRFRGCSCR